MALEIEKAVKAKYQSAIDEKEKIHKRLWHQIQQKRAYIADVKTMKTSKSEKMIQISSTHSEIKTLQEQHKEAKKEFDIWFAELEEKMREESKS